MLEARSQKAEHGQDEGGKEIVKSELRIVKPDSA
jgi:hypothetical protein